MLHTVRIVSASAALILALSASAQTMPGAGELPDIKTAVWRSSEAKANLMALYTAERAHSQKKSVFGEDFPSIGFVPEHKNRYTYFIAPSGPAERRGATDERAPHAVIIGPDEIKNPEQKFVTTLAATACPVTLPKGMTEIGVKADSFVAVAAARLTSGPDYDCWSVSSTDRIASNAAGEKIPAGTPYHEKVGYSGKLAEEYWLVRQLVGSIANEACKSMVWTNHQLADSFEALLKADIELRPDFKPVDPWGHPIAYRKTNTGVTVSSPGPNGEEGDSDDFRVSMGNDCKRTFE